MPHSEIILPRKWALKAHGQRVVFTKNSLESPQHVIMKALLWALYLPQYPNMQVEVRVGDRYKPDVVAFDDANGLSIYQAQRKPLFWGESQHVGLDKIRALARRYPDTHLAIARWESPLEPFRKLVESAIKDAHRRAPFDLLRFTAEHYAQCIDDSGSVSLNFDQVQWVRL